MLRRFPVCYPTLFWKPAECREIPLTATLLVNGKFAKGLQG
jgi:hypothetical protein